MKKVSKAILLVLTLALCAVAFAGCAKTISGEYSSAAGIDVGGSPIVGGETIYKFSGNKVTVTVKTVILGGESSKSFEGTYEIIEENDKKKIKLTFGDDGAKSYSGTFSFAEGEKNGKKFIEIAGVKYGKK